MLERNILGRRRDFVLTILSERGSYPPSRLRLHDALYVASPELGYTVVPAETPNEFEFCEVSWASLGEIRFWGAMALGVPEGQGFHYFYPLRSGVLCMEQLNERVAHRFAERLSANAPAQSLKLHWFEPSIQEIDRLYDALLGADDVLLRGVGCFLKAHLFWGEYLLMEEMAINLHISLEAGLSTVRKRLSGNTGRAVSYDAVYQFLGRTLRHGDALVEFWRDRRDDRNMLLHPDCDLGSHALPPMSADDVYELLDPMLSLYRYILIGAQRPTG